MLKILIFSLSYLLFLVLPVSCKENSELLFVQILFRHGDRAPINLYPNDPNPESFWKEGLGKLTMLGRKQHYALGKFLKHMYENFTTSSPNEIMVISSECDRCMKSAETNVASFFAPSSQWQFEEDLRWQPISILYIPKEEDKFLETDSYCPRATQEQARVLNSPEGQAFIAKHKAYKTEIFDKFGMDAFKKGWFTETGTLNGDQALSIEVEKVLYHERSKYQDVLVFDSKRFGRTLVLDNAIQCTEHDEFSYQEMITFLPLNSHPQPKKVLIIGGGDGGVVREAVKHPSVESVTLCEIDEKVIEVSKQFLPFMAKGFDDPKLTVHIGDGAEFVKNQDREFDVIITDSSDPKGPAVDLFRKPYYESLRKALKPGGIISSQGECFWFDLDLVKEMIAMCRNLFPVVDYGSSYVSSYPGGQIGYLLCSSNSETNFREPLHKFTPKTLKDLGLRYYTPDIHKAAFALPLYIAEETGLN